MRKITIPDKFLGNLTRSLKVFSPHIIINRLIKLLVSEHNVKIVKHTLPIKSYTSLTSYRNDCDDRSVSRPAAPRGLAASRRI